MATQTSTTEASKAPSISLPSDFEIHGVTNKLLSQPITTAPTSLLILDSFKGNFTGQGFNTIFRPHNRVSKTDFPKTPQGPDDNILELNLTTETLVFTKPLGSVPNRGLSDQGDIFLNGKSYIQTIQDVTNPKTGKADGPSTEIHFEPGLWMHVPASTNNPKQIETLNRMASIPHGTTINAQGVAPAGPTPGPPKIGVAKITPFQIGNPSSTVPPGTFPSQTVDRNDTFRIPQDLAQFKKEQTITQPILDDPNTVLRNANIGKSINKTTTFKIFTNPQQPQLGGGTANIDFLMGGAAPQTPNAHASQMEATFWVSEVSHKITVPPHTLGQGPLVIAAPSPSPGVQAPSFKVNPPKAITADTTITVTSTQIQYSQTVLLDFAGLSWPHVSVATLIPQEEIEVPQSVFP
ncbi:hypothetical protein ACLMJK_003808 [Lecanora helva]